MCWCLRYRYVDVPLWDDFDEGDRVMVDGFFKRWKRGVETLPPSYLLRVKRASYVGQVCGLLLVMFVMAFSGLSYWLLFLLFVLVVLVVEFVGVHQQVKELEKFGGW